LHSNFFTHHPSLPLSLITHFQDALAKGSFLKCTLGKPSPAADAELTNVYLRPVTLKKGPHIAFNYRYRTRDEVKNFSLPDAAAQLDTLLNGTFLQAMLMTTEADWTLSIAKDGTTKLQAQKPSQTERPDTQHDKAKNRLLDPATPWLHALHISNAKGEILPNAQDKWRQINKYIEVIDSLLKEHPIPKNAVIADMGSGKGYLTFALYDYLTHHLKLTPDVEGIELRPHLVELCNQTAQKYGFDRLHFVAKDIALYRPDRLDMLIALHACDTATDLAIAAGIHNKATHIITAPCCHKQIRRDMHTQNELAPLLRYGILEERQAELVTDGIRALLLEAHNYKTKVFEFISTEHTAKNVMITATAKTRPDAAKRLTALEQVAAIKKGFGIQEHYLEMLLARE